MINIEGVLLSVEIEQGSVRKESLGKASVPEEIVIEASVVEASVVKGSVLDASVVVAANGERGSAVGGTLDNGVGIRPRRKKMNVSKNVEQR